MMNELVAHNDLPFALSAKLRWSKNVLEERQAPPQIILGAHDPDFCPLVNLGLFLEQMYTMDENEEGQVNCFAAIARSAKNSKSRASRILRKEVFEGESFVVDVKLPKELGLHSLRKGAASFARRNGCSRDDINVRGRWKRGKMKYLHRSLGTIR